MRELLTTITSKGQVTIPVEIRRLLRVVPHDKIAFVVEGDQIRLMRTADVVERTAGAIKVQKPPQNAKKLREAAERAIAKEVVERTSG